MSTETNIAFSFAQYSYIIDTKNSLKRFAFHLSLDGNCLFVLCVTCSLAQSQQYDQDGVIDIFRQYGDHLYNKGDHDGAIAQYIKTISKLEASYVIRKVRLSIFIIELSVFSKDSFMYNESKRRSECDIAFAKMGTEGF